MDAGTSFLRTNTTSRKRTPDIVNTVWGEDTVRITWKRSLTAPFDGNSLWIRYASAALVVPQDEELLLVFYEPIWGYKYHGHGTGLSQLVTFQAAKESGT